MPDDPVAPDGADAPLAPLDPETAAALAAERGLRRRVVVPHPARCPDVPAAADPNPLAPAGELAPLGFQLDALLGAGVGVPEAVALLGPPALCNHEPGSRFAELHLAPRSSAIRAATVETRSGALIGLVVDYEAPPRIPAGSLRRRYGAPQSAPSSPHSTAPPPAKFTVETAEHSATILLFPQGRGAEADLIRQVIVRRWERRRILPPRFADEAALVRLAVLALDEVAADPVDFYGSLGVYAGTEAGVTTLSRVAGRNVAAASLTVTDAAPVEALAVELRFDAPFAVDPERLAARLAAELDVTTSIEAEDAGPVTLRLRARDGGPRGIIVLDRRGPAVAGVALRRPVP
ncbi:MAG: hypothetical protein R3A79_21815 [Nannocystaceae bacterium]